MIGRIIAGLCVASSPVLAYGQGLKVAEVIPVQSVRPAAGFPLAQAAVAPKIVANVAAAEPSPMPACNMPVARTNPDTAAGDQGGVRRPPDRSVPMLVARSGCRNLLVAPAAAGGITLPGTEKPF